MMKRILSLLLAVVLAAGMIPGTAFAAEGTETAAQETEAVTEATEAAQETTEAAAEETEAAAEETEAIVEETEEAVVETTEAVVEETEAAQETEPVAETTEAAAQETEAPTEETEAAEEKNLVREFEGATPLNTLDTAWMKGVVSFVSAADVGDEIVRELEDNNCRMDADNIGDNQTVIGTISGGEDADYFKLVLAKDTPASEIYVTMISSYRYLTFTLLDEYGNRYGSVPTVDQGLDEDYFYDTLSGRLPKGTYYLCVENEDATDTEERDYIFYVNTVPVPTMRSKNPVFNLVQGVRIYWNNVPGVTGYAIYRSTSKDGPYAKIGAVGKTNTYVDKNVRSGKTYFYAVAALDTDVKGGLYSTVGSSDSRGVAFVETPALPARENTAQGVKLTWKYISGATGYRIYRKGTRSTDEWERIGEVKSPKTLTFTDKDVKHEDGITYKYTIRALGGATGTTLSGCYANGFTWIRLRTMEVKAAEKTAKGKIKVYWSEAYRATGYEIRLTKVSTGDSAKPIYVGGAGTTSRTISNLTPGAQYKVQIRSVCSTKINGKTMEFRSGWSEPVTVKP